MMALHHRQPHSGYVGVECTYPSHSQQNRYANSVKYGLPYVVF